MITSARTEILVAGFAITEAGGVLSQLAEAARRGVRILLVCSDWKSKAGQTAAGLVSETWPEDSPRPQTYEYNNEAETAGMHIKGLLVDGTDLLIGSANFTFPGMNTNFLRWASASTDTSPKPPEPSSPNSSPQAASLR